MKHLNVVVLFIGLLLLAHPSPVPSSWPRPNPGSLILVRDAFGSPPILTILIRITAWTGP